MIERNILLLPFGGSIDMGSLRVTKNGMILSIKVIPGARKNEIVGWQNGFLKIKVSAQPEKGAANRAIIQLLANVCKLPQSKIILLKGAASRQKEFLLEGYTKLDFTVD
jgi:uncharacterized protein